MIKEFERIGIDTPSVKWILYPNKDELSDELIREIVVQHDSYCCGVYHPSGHMKLGQISCSYKHYLALKDIVEFGYDYGIIMEDNMAFKENNVPTRIERYINELNKYYPDWDVLFDYSQGNYTEGEVTPDRFVYPKSNEITDQGHGGTRCACFYMVNQKSARKLYENFLPFNHAPDWFMNDLFRRLNMKSFWVEPPNVDIWIHASTA